MREIDIYIYTVYIVFHYPFQGTIPVDSWSRQSTLWSSKISTHRMWRHVAWCEWERATNITNIQARRFTRKMLDKINSSISRLIWFNADVSHSNCNFGFAPFLPELIGLKFRVEEVASGNLGCQCLRAPHSKWNLRLGSSAMPSWSWICYSRLCQAGFRAQGWPLQWDEGPLVSCNLGVYWKRWLPCWKRKQQRLVQSLDQHIEPTFVRIYTLFPAKKIKMHGCRR